MSNVQATTYPIAEDVMNLGRSLINDMIRSTGGQVLTDTAPYTVFFLNSAIRKTQRYLANNGLRSNIVDNYILSSISPVANSDPGTQVSISPAGYFDGAVVHATPNLPPDCLLPLELMQRVTGSGAQFVPMSMARGPLMSRIPTSFFGEWEWRGDSINMVGSTSTMDLRLRYEGRLPRIAQNANFSQTTINIRDGEDALALGMVMLFSFSRGSAQRQEAKLAWKEECDELVNRYVRMDQRIAVRPRGYAAGGGTIDGAMSGDYR